MDEDRALRARIRREVVSPRYNASLLRDDWPLVLSQWLKYLRVPHVVDSNEAKPPDEIPWDGDKLFLYTTDQYGPVWWIYCALHYAAADNDSKNPDRILQPGFGLQEETPERLSVLMMRTKRAAMFVAATAGANEDYLWRPAMHWGLTKAALSNRVEEIMGRHLDQTRHKVTQWRSRFATLGMPVPPMLWNKVLIDA